MSNGQVAVFGVAVSSFLVNVIRRHPQARWRALIDYDIALVMTPTNLLGTTVGVFLYVVSFLFFFSSGVSV